MKIKLRFYEMGEISLGHWEIGGDKPAALEERFALGPI
jgi:hypothetical protein